MTEPEIEVECPDCGAASEQRRPDQKELLGEGYECPDCGHRWSITEQRGW